MFKLNCVCYFVLLSMIAALWLTNAAPTLNTSAAAAAAAASTSTLPMTAAGTTAGVSPSVADEDATETHDRKIVDFDNPDPTILRHIELNNINITALRLEQLSKKAKMRVNVPPFGIDSPEAMTQRNNESELLSQRKQEEEIALETIKDIITTSIFRNGTSRMPKPSVEVATHDMAAFPVCGLPRNTNESFWTEGNTWNLNFLPPLSNQRPNAYLSSAILRLWKIDPNDGDKQNHSRPLAECNNPMEEMIRVTVSAYTKKSRKADRKKKMCSSTMIAKSFSGWIEMDVRAAIKLWEKPNRNLGLAIDIQDQEENSLKASAFFQPQNCEEASSPAIPWNFYREHLSWSVYEMERLPLYPRIDLRWSAYVRTHPYHHHRRANYHYQMDAPAVGVQQSANGAHGSAEVSEAIEQDQQLQQQQQQQQQLHQDIEQQNQPEQQPQPHKMHKKRHLQHKHNFDGQQQQQQQQQQHQQQQTQHHHERHFNLNHGSNEARELFEFDWRDAK